MVSDSVEKYGAARQGTNGNTKWRMRVACWISKTTRAHVQACARKYKHEGNVIT
jgi:hypothetical protein